MVEKARRKGKSNGQREGKKTYRRGGRVGKASQL